MNLISKLLNLVKAAREIGSDTILLELAPEEISEFDKFFNSADMSIYSYGGLRDSEVTKNLNVKSYSVGGATIHLIEKPKRVEEN